MRFCFFFSIFCVVAVSSTQWDQVGDSLHGYDETDRLGYSLDLSRDGKRIVVGTYRNSNNRGYVEVYELNNTSWRLVHDQIILGDEMNDLFGSSVSISHDGTRIAVGAPHGVRNKRGYFKVLADDGRNWESLIKKTGIRNNDKLGHSVSLSGDGRRVAAGSPWSDEGATNSGAVKIFRENSSGTWSQKGHIAGLSPREYFGTDVALSADGKTLVAGAPNGQGRARVYQENSAGTDWIKIVAFTGNSQRGSAKLGESVSISGDGNTVAAGGPEAIFNSQLRAGSVQIFRLDNGEWNQVHNSIGGRNKNDKCGTDVKLSTDGKKVAIACKAEGSGTPRVTVYEEGLSSWNQLYQSIVQEESGDNWGTRLALSGNAYFFAGSGFGHDVGGGNSGYVRIFIDGNYETVSPTTPPTATPTHSPTTSPTASPTLNPSHYPSLSPTHPTQSPTVFPSMYPTTSPTLSPVAPTTLPSLYPTEGPLEEFFIRSIAFTNAYSTNVITIETQFGILTDNATIAILKRGCDVEVSNGALTILHTKNITESEKTMTSEITIHSSNLEGSNVQYYNSTSSLMTIEFCIKTIAFVFDETEDVIPVLSEKSEYIIKDDGIGVDFNIENINVQQVTNDISLHDDMILDLGVKIVRCSKDSNLEFIASLEDNAEFESVYLCLSPNSKSRDLSDINVNITYGNEVLPLIVSSNPHPLATIEKVSLTTRISFPIIAEFYKSGNTQVLIDGYVGVGSSGVSKFVGDDVEKVHFAMSFELASRDENGCLQMLIMKMQKFFL